MTHKFDIFEVTTAIQTKNFEYFNSLSEKQLHQLPIVVIQRWLSGVQNRLQIVLLSEFSNKYVFSLFNHPKLLIFLLMVCTEDGNKRVSWIPKNKTIKYPKIVEVVSKALGYSKRESFEVQGMISDNDILEEGERLGLQDQELKTLKQELKLRAKEDTNCKI